MPPLTPQEHISAYRSLMRILLFAGIAALTGWLTFTTYSAKLDRGKTDIPPQRGSSATPARNSERVDINKSYGKLPLTFEANLGQSDPSVKYIARGAGYNIFLTPAEAVLVFPDRTATKERATEAEALEEFRTGAEFEDRHLDHSRRGREQREAKERRAPAVVRMQLVGANPNPRAVEGRDERPGKVNYFIGDDSSKWLTNIPTYGKVAYSGVYPGVDLVYYGNRHQLEYDLIVAPGADPSVIQINFAGAQGLRVDKRGDLWLQTKAGEMRQTKPSIFQEVNGVRKPVNGGYVLKRGNRVGFKISRYDRHKALVIDPILNYFSIANNSGNGYAITVDAEGFAYITGTVPDALFNPTPGGFQQVSGGGLDGFVTKISPDGTDCIYSTYVGGTGFDESYGIAVDGQGNAHITGYAQTGFPVTPGALQTTLADTTDAFIAKLNSTGSALLYSTFFGGNGFEEGDGIKLDSAGNAYVVGLTTSTTLPTSVGAGQTAAGGGYDAFVMSLNSTGSALRYSTYFGGSAQDYGLSIAIDSATNAYITGQTRSLDLSTVNSITAAGGFDRGLFRSLDAGSSWSLSRNGLTDSQISAIAVAPSSPTIVYGGTSGTVFKSTDAGVNWFATNLNAAFVRALAVDPTNSSVVYAGSEAGVFKTTDGGSSWTRLTSDITFSLAIDPGTPTVIYAGIVSGISKTTNGGGTWTPVFSSGAVRALAIDPSNTSIVYGGRTNGVLKTTDGGANWVSMNTGLINLNVRTLAITSNAPGTIYAGTLGGVFKTTNAAANWSAANSGFLTPYTDNVSRLPAQVNGLSIDPSAPSTIYAATTNFLVATGAYPLSSILKSTDAGASWTAITNGFGSLNSGFLAIAIDPTTPTRVYAGNNGDIDGFVIKVNPSGSAFPFASYLGGGRADNATGIALNPSGDLHIAGSTGSLNFPTTAGAYQMTLRGALDLFVTKISAATNTIVYSTYLGGNGFDHGIVGIAVDSSGSAYVNGRTASTDFPVTPGAFQTTIGNSGSATNTDESVTKLNSTGSALVYSSYLGGAGNEHVLPSTVSASKIAVDAAGSVYLVGVTDDSSALPVFDFVNGGSSRTYIAKIDGNTASYSITGRLTTAANAPIAGIFVEATNGQGFSRGGISDSQGFYSVISLPAGDYTFTPFKFATTGNHYIFTPTSRTFTGLNSDQTANFTGTQVYNISGRITSSTVAGLGIFDVTVNLSGAASATAVTDAEGGYSFEDLLSGNYVVTPSKPGFTFNPVNRSFTNLNTDQFTADFTTASTVFFTVSGRAADQSNNSISNVVISMVSRPQRGSRVLTTQTDANGNYSFPNLQSGGNYTFLATKPLLSFTPQNPTLTNLSANQTLNFLAAPVTGLVGKMAFETDQGINVMNADTTGETNVTNNGFSPVWSPDGSKIAFVSDRDAGTVGNFVDLYVMNADGTGVTRITNSPLDDAFPSWAPNQQQLTYTYGNLDCDGGEFGFQPEVFVINADGSSPRNLTNTVLPDGLSDWSPGGSSIAFARLPTGDCSDGEGNILAMDSGGGNERLLANSPDGEIVPAYSPDGSRIAYVRESIDSSGNLVDESLYVMNADGSDQIKISPDLRIDEEGKPTWSPDGTKIAFSGNLPGEFGPEQIFVINADGTGFAQLTSGGSSRRGPSWQHYSISGRVNGNINGLPVTMVLAGTLTRVTQSDANGNYVFGNLTPGGNYSVTPVSSSFVFTPPKIDVNNLVGNQIANFTSTAAIPAPTPPLADDFAAGQRDPGKWNLGTQTQPLGAFDPQVTVLQQAGRLVITPRTNTPGLHYNGYVAVNSFNFKNGTATVEVAETATNGADTVFAIGSDLENFTRFVVRAGDGAPGVSAGRNKLRPNTTVPQLIFQVTVGGQLTSSSIPYDPVEHRYMRFRHEPPTNAIIFETSRDAANVPFIERHRVTLVRSVSALTAELSAGTSTPTDPPGQTVFDNFQLVTNTFQFSAPSYSITEGNASAQLLVTRTGNVATPATVEYSSFDESATQRTKFILATGTLTFGPGETTKSLSVLIVDNVLVEGSQTLSVQLVDSTGSGLNSPGRAVLTIVDNDTTPPTNNPLDQSDAQFYVRQHYYDFLSRIPDQSGLDFWTNQITSCGTDAQCRQVKRVNVSAAYFLSIEFQETGFFVHRFYNAALNRANGLPRYLEFLRDTQSIGRGVVVGTPGWEAQLEANKAAYAQQFVLRTEFFALYPSTMTPTQFVDAVYAHAVTVPSAGERQAAIDEFAIPTGARGRALRRVIENQILRNREFNRAFVLAQYFGYLRRNPDDQPDNNLDGYNFWLSKLNQFNGNFVESEMVKSFIVSGEYRQRFGP